MPKKTKMSDIPCALNNARYYYDKGVSAGFYLSKLYTEKEKSLRQPQVIRKQNLINQIKSLKTEHQYRIMPQRDLQVIARDLGLTNYMSSKTDLLPRLIPLLKRKMMILS